MFLFNRQLNFGNVRISQYYEPIFPNVINQLIEFILSLLYRNKVSLVLPITINPSRIIILSIIGRIFIIQLY